MKKLVLAALLAALATPALAQNAGQISTVQRGAACPGCNLFQADLSRKVLSGKSFARARLRQADLTAVTMANANLANSDLRDVNAYAGLFTGANFTGADLTNATFVGSYLQGARFSGANLSGVNFSGAEMDRASGLTQRQLAGACGDSLTKLPRGLTSPPSRLERAGT
jgi:uncharacterized protein YjbI with pentapeptide repeats